MPISGLVVTLAEDAKVAALTTRAIRDNPHFTLGRQSGRRWPVVLDTPARRQDRSCWEWLIALPGVVHVDVTFIHFDCADGAGEGTHGSSRQERVPAW